MLTFRWDMRGVKYGLKQMTKARAGSVALMVATIFTVIAVAAEDADRPRLYTNETYVEDVTRTTSLPLSDTKAMFAYVLESLPDRVKVYPTENYYYFYFYDNGTRYAGNIRLDVMDRDEGKLHFAYYVELTDWKKENEVVHVVLGKADGVTVEKLERLVYRISYGQKSVVFSLNDLSNVVPPAKTLGPDEKFLGPIFDESAIRFFLVYNKKLKIFHYILDETVMVADEFFPSRRTDRILIGRRTGFAFYRDHRLDRKILIGAYEANGKVNNYFDGPFDQLPDNFIEGDELRQAILEIEPGLAGKIDRFGSSPDGADRYLIDPYTYYRTEEDLYSFYRCATSKKIPREKYYTCFVAQEPEYGDAPAVPTPPLKSSPKTKRKSSE